MNNLEKSALIEFLSDLVSDCVDEDMTWGETGGYILRCLAGRGFRFAPEAPLVMAEKNEEGLAEITCPLCGKTHRHSWASGHRGAHCSDPKKRAGGYILFCPETDPLDRIRHAIESRNWP